MGSHRRGYKSFQKDMYGKCMSYDLFDEYGVENCSIVLIENYPCESKEELLKRERYWIETIECANKRKPIASLEEQKAREKNWREENREKLTEYKNQHFDCECGGKYARKDKATHERSKKHQNFISPIDKDAVGNQEK
jgi:hypothetical protein